MRKVLLPAFLPILLLTAQYAFGDDAELKAVVENGKKATVLVAVGGSTATGSAFCVHSSGLFLTAYDVVFGADKMGEISLSLNVGERDARSVKAQVVLKDEAAGLVLIKSTEPVDLPAVKLGNADDFYETMPVYTFGYPSLQRYGPPPPLTNEAPSINIKVCRLVALSKENGTLKAVVIDTTLNSGNSGGPILNSKGELVGMLQGAAEERYYGLNRAVSANRIAEFISRPVICFVPPANVTIEDMVKETTLTAQVIDMRKDGGKDLQVEITLAPEGRIATVLKMERADNEFTAAAPLIREGAGQQKLKAIVQYDNGEIRGFLEPTVFKVGDGEVDIGRVARIKGGERPQIILRDNSESFDIDPDLKLTLDLGPKSIQIQAAEFRNILVAPPMGPPSYIKYVISVKSGEAEIGRMEGVIRIETADAGAEGLTEKPVKCPSQLGNIVEGMGGDVLICHFPALRKLGVFNLSKREFVKQIDLAEGDVRFAAGRDKLYIAYAGKNAIETWDLKTFEKEQTTELAFSGKITSIAIGADTAGPLLIVVDGEFPDTKSSCALFDTTAMKPNGDKLPHYDGHLRKPARASMNGAMFVFGTSRLRLTEGHVTLGVSNPQSDRRYLLPGADGKSMYSIGFVDPGLEGGMAPPRAVSPYELYVPSDGGDFYIGIALPASPDDTSPRVGTVTLYRLSDKSFVISLGKIQIPQGFLKADDPLGIENRIWFLSRSGLIVLVPDSNDTLVLMGCNPDKKAATSVIISEPPTIAVAGQPFVYALKIRTSIGPPKYTLENCPEGMIIDKMGVIRWEVPGDYSEKEVEVTVMAKDIAGTVMVQSFKLKIVKNE